MKTILGIQYLEIEDIANEFNKSCPTIYRWIKEGKLKGRKCGNQMLFSKDDIAHFIEHSRTGGDDAASSR